MIKKSKTNLKGTTKRPRLSVYRSAKVIYAQIIDDQKGKTLVSASSREVKAKEKMTKVAKAALVGEVLAKKALKANIKAVVFDRGRYPYHGRVKALAEGARKGGLKF
jgi:large subunit ribosomal protein L18